MLLLAIDKNTSSDALNVIIIFPSAFGINTCEAQVFPHFCFERIVFVGFVDIETEFDGSDEGMRLPC